MADEEDFGRRVHARIPYVSDKEIHVSTVTSPDELLLVDAREYIPSLDAYGRGLTFPMPLLNHFMEGLEDIWHAHGAGEKGSPTEPPRG
jgi:hypothetical protein